MKSVKKRPITAIIISVMLIVTSCILTACNNAEIPLSSLKTDNIFQYSDALWGISPDEANKTLKNTIVQESDKTPESGEFVIYKMEKLQKIKGYDVFMTFEFAKDKLRQIVITFKNTPDNYEKCFDEVKSELIKLYGEGESGVGKTGNDYTHWLIENTQLDVYKVNGNEPFVFISLGDRSQFSDIQAQ